MSCEKTTGMLRTAAINAQAGTVAVSTKLENETRSVSEHVTLTFQSVTKRKVAKSVFSQTKKQLLCGV